MGLCEDSAPWQREESPISGGEQRGMMGLLFSCSPGGCAGKRNPLQQLVTVPAPIAGGAGNPFAGSGSLSPASSRQGSPPHTQSPPSSIPPPSPQRNPQGFLSPLFFCVPPAQPLLSLSLLNSFCLAQHCSAAFCAQNNFCSGNSSPSLSALLQYFSLAFALRDVVEH